MATESFSGYLTATAEQQRPRCAKRSVSVLSSEAEFATFLILVIAVIGGPICFWLVHEKGDNPGPGWPFLRASRASHAGEPTRSGQLSHPNSNM